MADLSITAGNVAWVSGTAPETAIAGETITAGQPLYLSSGQWFKADANSATAAANSPSAVALTGGSVNGYIMIAKAGAVINIGATITAGVPYFQSATAGGIAPVADLTTTWVVFIIGVAKTSANMTLLFVNGGVTL